MNRGLNNIFFLQDGFVLIEILTAVAIIILISSISWAVFQNLQPSWRLTAVTRDLITDLKYAQQLSITEQINYSVKFNPPSGYQVLKLTETPEILREKFLPNGIIFSKIEGLDDEKRAVFNPYGAVLEPGKITLSNETGGNKNIEIKPSGFVKIQE